MHMPSDASIRRLVHSLEVALFLGTFLVGVRAPNPPCCTGSAAKSLRSGEIAGTANKAGRRLSYIASSSGSNTSLVSSIDH
eukprot:7362895-Ditylum_brightwellii.AAC.1